MATITKAINQYEESEVRTIIGGTLNIWPIVKLTLNHLNTRNQLLEYTCPFL